MSSKLCAPGSGYILKIRRYRLVAALQQVCRGQVYLSPESPGWFGCVPIEVQPARRPAVAARARSPPIDREGKSTKDVASILGVSLKTAESHRSRLMQKLDITRRQPREVRCSERLGPTLTGCAARLCRVIHRAITPLHLQESSRLRKGSD